MINRITLFLLLISLLLSCDSNISKSEVSGLWELEELKIDEKPENFIKQYLSIESDNTFSIASPKKDIVGLYAIKGNKLVLNSEDEKWYNASWKVHFYEDKMLLTGRGTYPKPSGYGDKVHQLNTKLLFVKTESIPDNSEFVSQLIGKWELYKIRTENSIEKQYQTYFSIESDGKYSISKDGEDIGSGVIEIDARHKKILFQQEQKSWDAKFYGAELRLKNDEMGIQYSLRR